MAAFSEAQMRARSRNITIGSLRSAWETSRDYPETQALIDQALASLGAETGTERKDRHRKWFDEPKNFDPNIVNTFDKDNARAARKAYRKWQLSSR